MEIKKVRLSTEIRKVRKELQRSEWEHGYDLRKQGSDFSLGRKAIFGSDGMGVQSDIFTGSGLCIYSSAQMQETLRKKFPDMPTQIVRADVEQWDGEGTFSHYWLRMQMKNGKTMFADATYGQIRPWLRWVFDFADNEPAYYGEGIRPSPSNITVKGAIEELRVQAYMRFTSMAGGFMGHE